MSEKKLTIPHSRACPVSEKTAQDGKFHETIVILMRPDVPNHNGDIYTKEALKAMAEESEEFLIDGDGNLCQSVGAWMHLPWDKDRRRNLSEEDYKNEFLGIWVAPEEPLPPVLLTANEVEEARNRIAAAYMVPKEMLFPETPMFEVTSQKVEPYPYPTTKVLGEDILAIPGVREATEEDMERDVPGYFKDQAEVIARAIDQKIIRELEGSSMEKHGVEKDETKTKTAGTLSGRCPQCGAELSKDEGGEYICHCPICGTLPFEKKGA